ncbi:hypothetical protein GOARA_052_00290 [Gordonia araii NBRC 100433]|uniref:DUF2567 domain-containing protein n=1 Tax=Gordonia araii NBRC 100433 TaxID=1073574 RepID=G7H2Q5_9ACTN|nr:DUF2567 domain-containing protein [Gordonia araii]NNG98544.1 DUF2567 domain-containing protein [Gordonia araii NBRC 100433]GAB10130.1 hypothetical protein GOARA_052_00290 [Gordonia araii NBRC 100433]
MSEPVILAPGPSDRPLPSGHVASPWRANVLVAAQAVRFVVGVAVVSSIAALVWAFVAPMPTGVVVRRGYAAVPNEQMTRYFDGIAWFALGLLVLGAVAGTAFWWSARTWRGPLGVLVLAATTVFCSGLAIEVALTTLRTRLPDPLTLDAGQTFLHAPNLWMTAPADGAVGAPGILLILMPTMALLGYFFHALFADSPALDADSAFDDDDADGYRAAGDPLVV